MEKPAKELSGNGHLKVVFIILSVIALGLLLLWARAFYGSWSAFQEGETFLKKGEYVRAITFFDRSIHWYTPFNPYVEKSAQRLWEIGEQAEERGDNKLALIAFRTIRGGFYAARSLYTPGEDWIRRSEAKIDLLAKAPPHTLMPTGQEVVGPDPVWSLIVVISFLGWVGSMMGLIIFSFQRKAEPTSKSRSSLLWIGLAGAFFALWILSMVKA